MRFKTGLRALALTSAVALLGAAATANAKTLSFSQPGPPRSALAETQIWWAEEVEKQTAGSVEVEFYWLESLAKLADALPAVNAGLADIAQTVPAYHKAKLPLWYLSSTATGTGDQYVVSEAWRRTRDKFPAIAEEEKANGVKYLFHYSIGPTVLLVGAAHSPSTLRPERATRSPQPHACRRRRASGPRAPLNAATNRGEGEAIWSANWSAASRLPP